MRRGLILISALIVGGGAIFALQPKRWPDSWVQAWLLRQTPPGTDARTVVRFLERRGWLDDTYSAPGGFVKDRPGTPYTIVGARSVRAVLGDYRGPDGLFVFVTSTEAFYGFDNQGHLLEVWVRKTTDAL